MKLEVPPGVVAPAFWTGPDFKQTLGDEVAEICHLANFDPDPQQKMLLDAIFAHGDDGLSVMFEVAAIVGRQNLKTGLFKQAALGWLFVTEERLVVWSAHERTTAAESQRDLEELIGSHSALSKRVKRFIHSHAEEAIELKNGSRISFKTRTLGGGRGLTGNKIIFDEAFALIPGHMGALLPLLSVVPDPQLLYGSAAGLAMSEVLRDLRDRGRPGNSPRLCYCEYAAPDPDIACDAGRGCTHRKNAKGCGCDKPDMWLMANPTIGNRMTLEYVKAERQAMPIGEFTRERMGWWDDPRKGHSPLILAHWYGVCSDAESTIDRDSPISLAIDIPDDASSAAIGVAGFREDGLVHGELVEYMPGTGWLMDRIMGIVDRREPAVLVLNPASPAGAFEKSLRSRGFVTVSPNTDKAILLKPDQHLLQLAGHRDWAQACGDFVNEVTNETFRHPDQSPVNSAAEIARARETGDVWVWDTRDGNDISPLNVVTLAKFGLSTFGKRKAPVPFVLT